MQAFLAAAAALLIKWWQRREISQKGPPMDAKDMNAKDRAIQQLKAQIEAQRARIDPDVLKKAQKAADASQKPKTRADLVPFDREAAALVVRLFLDRHDDPEWFKRQLQEQLKKERP